MAERFSPGLKRTANTITPTGMRTAIVLLMDPGAEAQVLETWTQLRDTGLSSTMLDIEARPHVTLAVYDDLDAAAFRVRAEPFFRAEAPIGLSLSSAGTFPGEMGPVFLAPVVTPALLGLHTRFHEQFSDLESTSHAHYRPDAWVPHATVGLLLDDDEVPRAVKMARAAPLPIEGRFVSVLAVLFEPGALKPVETLYEFALGG